jgi:hypothetical protein
MPVGQTFDAESALAADAVLTLITVSIGLTGAVDPLPPFSARRRAFADALDASLPILTIGIDHALRYSLALSQATHLIVGTLGVFLTVCFQTDTVEAALTRIAV